MITFYEGTPGAGKSYDVVRKIIANLCLRRRVITNVEGLDDEKCLEMIKFKTGFDDYDLHKYLFFLDTNSALRFWEYVTPGCIVVIDEAHKLFNARDWQSVKNRQCADWCSTARHDGIDVVFITQRLEKCDAQIRSLTQYTYRYRKVDFMGSLAKKSFLCYVYDGDDTSHHMGRRSGIYDSSYFPCYKSYTGKEIKEMGIQKNINILKHPIFFIIPIVLLLTIYFFSQSSFIHGRIMPKPDIEKRVAAQNQKQNFQSKSPLVADRPEDLLPQPNQQTGAGVASAPAPLSASLSPMIPNIKNEMKKDEIYALVNGKKVKYCEQEGICYTK